MKLIVAEKPNAANAIAKVLNASKKDGYYENDEYQISWSFGHLVGLAMPDQYDEKFKRWTKEDLPILPDEFQLHLKDDSGIRKQFNTLKDLMTSADQVICATDNDREGDLIFHYIYTLSGCNTPYVRILPNDLSANGIKKALDKQIPPRTNVISSAECRSQADWLIGINGTRAITVSAGQKIPIGRVQTPTLALVCERFLANQLFKPTSFFPVSIQLEKDGITFKAKIKENPTEENEATKIVGSISDTSICTFSEKKQIEEKQPLPYYLSTLQIEASNKLNLTAQQTLDITQSLYEKHKITTYPRTDSGYLTTDLYNEAPDLLKGILSLFKESKYSDAINLQELPKTCINDKKAPNHHGIIPTSDLSAYQSLNTNEKAVFDLISKRFMAAFSEKCKKDQTKYDFSNNDQSYTVSGSIILEQGWRAIYQDSTESESEEDQDDESNDVTLPDVSENDSLKTSNANYAKSMTKAPSVLTQASLLQLMKSCGSKLEDQDLKNAMKNNELRTGGLGTEATRSGIIDNLFKVSLVTTEKKKIIPTDMGLSLYEQIKDLELSKPELTASWELKLDSMANGEYDSTTFIEEIVKYTITVTEQMLSVGANVDTDNLKLPCPKCKEGKVMEGKKGYGCSNWNAENKCDFVIWKESYGKKISLAIVQELIENGRTKSKIKGLKLPEKEPFDAYFILTEDFKMKASSGSGEVFKCPLCSGKVKINSAGAFCEKEDLKIFRKVGKKELSDAQLKQLLEKGKTGLIKGFTSKAEKKFDAHLILKDGGASYDFPEKKK